MTLDIRLGVDDPDSIDTTRPFNLCGFDLGPEAAEAAVNILRNIDTVEPLDVWSQEVKNADYFELHKGFGSFAKVISIPPATMQRFPTDMEISLVHAIHSCTDEQLECLTNKSCFAIIGEDPFVGKMSKLIKKINYLHGDNIASLAMYKKIHLAGDSSAALSDMDISCLTSYLVASPLKFKFVELYRLMEARYLDHVRMEFNALFNKQPKEAISSAAKSLESELSQIGLLSYLAIPNFEIIFESILGLRTTNKLAASLLRKLDNYGGNMKSPKHNAGAALVYYLRCAIVHAGGKDIIFENFEDSGILLQETIEHVEEAALALAGINLRN